MKQMQFLTFILLLILNVTIGFSQEKTIKSIEWDGYNSVWTNNAKLGFNHNSLKNKINGFSNGANTWEDKFYEQVNQLKPRIIRYPGGTVSQYWDWQNGKIEPRSKWDKKIYKYDKACTKSSTPIYYNSEGVNEGKGLSNHNTYRKQYIKRDQTTISHTLNSFKKELDNLNSFGTRAKAVIVLNVISRSKYDQAKFLKSVIEKGIPFDHVELGNEIYHTCDQNSDYTRVYPSVQAYNKRMNEWIKYFRNLKDSNGNYYLKDVKFAVVGKIKPPRNYDPNNREDIWLDGLLNNLNNSTYKVKTKADAIISHVYRSTYLNPGKGCEDDLPRFGTGLMETSDNVVENIKFNDTRNDVSYLFHKAKNAYNYVNDNLIAHVVKKGLSVWVTEFNIFEKQPAPYSEKEVNVVTTWSHGLYQAYLSLQFLKTPNVDLILEHTLTGNTGYQNIKNVGNKSGEWLLTASGITSSVINTAAYNKSRIRELRFKNMNNLSISSSCDPNVNDQKRPQLYGVELRNSNLGLKNREILLLNLDSVPLYLTYPSKIDSKQSFNYHKIWLKKDVLQCQSRIKGSLFDCPYMNTANICTQHLKQKVENNVKKGRLYLYPYSITRISISPTSRLAKVPFQNCIKITSGSNGKKVEPHVSTKETVNPILYPNPSNGILKISNIENITSKNLEILDLSGRLIKKIKLPDSTYINIDISNVSAGIYTLRGSNGEFSRRVVIK